MKKILFLLLISLPNLSFAQSEFQSQFSEFDKAVMKDLGKAKLLLDKIEQQKEMGNDTFIVFFSLKKAAYFKAIQKMDSAKFYLEKSAKLALHRKLYNSLASIYHDLAEILSRENKNDQALQYDSLAIQYAQKSGNLTLKNIIIVSIARKLRYKGEYEHSNKILFERLKNITSSEPETYGVALASVATNYDELGLYELTEKYYLEANEYLKKSGSHRLVSHNMANLASLYIILEEYKKALVYADSILFFSDLGYSKVFYHLRKSEAYKGLKIWDAALKHIDKVLVLDKAVDDEYSYTLDLVLKGQIYKDKGDFKKSFPIFKESKTLFEQNEVEDLVIQKQLYRDYIYSYLKLNNPVLMLDFQKYVDINERLSTQSQDKNLTEMEAKYNSQEKEAKIAIQKLEVEKQKNVRNLSLSGGGLILIFAGVGFFWYRTQQKKKALLTQNSLLNLEQSLFKMELSQLNQQLNPHEFKNLLSAISPQIQEKAPDAYKRMLQLMNVIQTSLYNSGFIETIDLQIKQVNDYLSIMQENLTESLSFFIENELEESVEFPRLLLKNLAENAVKHGIKGNSVGGIIRIRFFSKSSFNYLEVDDNGKGRVALKENNAGFGLASYKKLFKILNTKNNQNASLEVIDKNHGTKVIVKIPHHYKYH